MKKQFVISAAFRHADLSTEEANTFGVVARHERVSEVHNLLFENLPLDIIESLSIVGDVVTYTRIVNDVVLQAAITARVATLPEEFPQLELVGFHSVPREFIDEQYRKYILDHEKQKETAPEGISDDQSEAGR